MEDIFLTNHSGNLTINGPGWRLVSKIRYLRKTKKIKSHPEGVRVAWTMDGTKRKRTEGNFHTFCFPEGKNAGLQSLKFSLKTNFPQRKNMKW